MEMLIGGAWSLGAAEDVIEVRDPEDGSLVDTVPCATAADVDAAVEHAAIAAEAVRALPTHRRVEILRAAADVVAERRELHAETIAREGVKTIREARGEVARCIQTLDLAADEARRPAGDVLRFDQRPGSEHRQGYWLREPVGVVAAVTPFNDPLNLVAHKVAPALACGNAVIVKPHSATPLSALLLAEAFGAAGLPPGVLQVLTGHGAEIVEPLVRHPGVSMVTFTGGNAAGARIARAAAGKRIVLELGSNCPVIVLPDADLELAGAAIASGAFAAAGQNCLHVQRVIVHGDVRDALTAALVDAATRLRLGRKLDEATEMGPLISEESAGRVAAMLDDALALGGELLAGGGCEGTRMQPTIVGDLPRTSRLAREEVFGPVTGVIEVESLDEAIALANATDYGLHAGVFTRDVSSALRAVGELRCGAVMVNDSSDYRLDAMPFGGVRGSGLGREGLAAACHEMTTTKVVCFNV